MGKFLHIDKDKIREAKLVEVQAALRLEAERKMLEDVIDRHTKRLEAIVNSCTHSVQFEDTEAKVLLCVVCRKFRSRP